jgi:hypothetical protein
LPLSLLQNVLNILSPSVASNGDNVHATTQQVQTQCKTSKEEEGKRKDRRAFCLVVGASLTAIAISTKEEALQLEKDKVEQFTVALMEAEDVGDKRKEKFSWIAMPPVWQRTWKKLRP